ncbi:hypothetical protein SETIT_6G074000v2 [Setaria italica]|uniref:NHL repeat-containing protein 2 n=1 Tax=Setaria italica TaxID=4555 RepID=A0A368RKQ4_SETIT|nr:uncharacterized protein LOC101784498 [Setaria italica]RCV30190.1 hypothetical protein SETIT_6G074000v2 [Setaria italica]
MAQASSAAALLRRLRRHRTGPAAAAALLPRRLISSDPVPASSSLGALPGPSHLLGDGGGSGCGHSACSASHPRSRFPRRQHAAAMATRAVHQAASSSECPAAAASSEARTSTTTVASQSEIVDFIKSTFGKLEGQNHCWLNTMNDIWRNMNEEGIYLVLLYQSCGTLNISSNHSVAFERLKYLQQRYPRLNVFAVQHGSDITSLAAQSQAVHTIATEYIAFPILMIDKDFSNMTNGACYLLFEGSKDPMLFTNWVEEPDVIIKAIEELSLLKEPSENVLSRVSWQKEDVVREPYVGSFRNLLLNHPACISVDEDGNRIFISDSNHHRIIISNSDGMILDCIGSSPGFEDGEFESAKFLRPASSFYHADEDCLYIVDSENHAVRKADLGRRTLETVYPVSNKSSGIWSWITDKLGLRKEIAPTIQDFDADLVALPWHLIQISEDDLLVADRSFESPWILRISTGEKQDIGRAEVMESYQQTVNERFSLLKDIHTNRSSTAKELSDLLEKVTSKELVSSVSRFHNYIIFGDTDGQRVLKHDLDTKNTSNINFSNCEVLGLPYWSICNLERVSTWGRSTEQFEEHVRQVDVLPGRCNITVYIDIPADTELAAPLAENCICRQVRGSGAEVSGSDGPDTPTEKVGIAQQWYDELDNLAFSEVAQEPTTAHGGDDKPADQSYQDQRRVQFTCAVNVSPGTCELVASAALYLKLARATDDRADQEALVKQIMCCQRREEHACVELLMGSRGDARDLVVMKPVHLRLRLECGDHPAGATNKETISTESRLKINVSLD